MLNKFKGITNDLVIKELVPNYPSYPSYREG